MYSSLGCKHCWKCLQQTMYRCEVWPSLHFERTQNSVLFTLLKLCFNSWPLGGLSHSIQCTYQYGEKYDIMLQYSLSRLRRRGRGCLLYQHSLLLILQSQLTSTCTNKNLINPYHQQLFSHLLPDQQSNYKISKLKSSMADLVHQKIFP